MSRAIRFTAATVFAFSIATLGTQAQVAPVKPGLWQVQFEREVNGQKMPDMSERLKSMPPEKRAQVEAMMKKNGIAIDGSGGRQVCYTKENLDRSAWANQASDCKADFSSRSGSLWKWHTSCPKSGYEADGEAHFLNSENYTVKSTSVSKGGDEVRASTTTITAKWLGADCGSVQPLDLKP